MTAAVILCTVSPYWVLSLITFIVITVLIGVALPAVWSGDGRRKDAYRTLNRILRNLARLAEAALAHRKRSPRR